MISSAKNYYSSLAGLLVFSTVLHIGGLWILDDKVQSKPKIAQIPKVKIRVVKSEPKKEVVEPPKAIKIPPKKIIKKKSRPKTLRKAPVKKPRKKVVPIQGLSKSSFRQKKRGKGPKFQAPVGNTLFTKDKGIRVNSARRLSADLSASAKLKFFRKPDYTEAALDAELEGKFIIDAFVDDKGRVRSASMRKKVGYGMDKRLEQSALQARFFPRKNPAGLAISGWTEIKIILTLP